MLINIPSGNPELPWRRGAVDIASGTEDLGSNPARALGCLGGHSNAVVYNRLNIHCEYSEREKLPKNIFKNKFGNMKLYAIYVSIMQRNFGLKG
jgi:hypothetical protein